MKTSIRFCSMVGDELTWSPREVKVLVEYYRRYAKAIRKRARKLTPKQLDRKATKRRTV